jgi:hypothetical protein
VPEGTITVIKNVIAPIPYNDDVSDGHSFSVVLQKAPNWWGPWTTVDSDSIFGEGDNAVFTVDRGYWYRAVEGSDPDYIQGLNDGPVWLGYCDENKDITIKNHQRWALIKVNKEVVNHDGSDVDDNHRFFVKLESDDYTTPLHHFRENSHATFWVWPGTYTAAELGDDCYDLYDDGGSITVYSNDICGNELTVTNARKPGSITINKDGLVGDDQAVFTLYDGNGNPVGDPITLGNGGSDGWSELFWDSYTVVETVPEPDINDYYYTEPTFDPEGPYVVNCSVCRNNLNHVVNVTNNDPQIKTAEIIIRKVVNGTPNDSDFVFTVDDGVNPPYTINIDGAGGDSSPITVEAEKSYTITENNPGDCWDTTVADDAPAGVIATDDGLREASFTVDGANVDELDGSIITYTNTADPGKIIVHKEGMQLDDYAAFRLTGPNGYNVVKRVGGPSHWTTATFANLEWGTYTLTEIWVVEMEDNKYCYTSDLPEGGIEFTVGCESLEHNPVVVNTPELGTIRVVKSGLEGDDGIWFILKNSNGEEVSRKRVGTDAHWTTATFSNLYRGSYTLEELPIEGNYYTYKTDLNPGPYTIDCDKLYIEVPVENTAEKGSITICKTDAVNGEPLLGSTFELRKISGYATQTEANSNTLTAADSSFSSEWPKVVVLGVDTQGNCHTWADLPYGTYRVKETVAPKGYKLFGDPPTGEIVVYINDETTDIHLEKEIADPRIPGSVTIIKKDESGNTMDGVGFTIYYKSSGNPVMPEKFTSGGLVTFSGLGWGEYVISETTVPPGYSKAGNVGVKIGPDNAESGVTVTVNNSKTPPPPPPTTTTTTTPGGGIEVLGIMELPFTGMHPAIPISGISLILGGLAMFMASLKKKFRRK